MKCLREFRKAQKWTQEEFAKRADISKNYVYMLESGRVRPSVSLAKRLGKLMDVDWRTLFEDET